MKPKYSQILVPFDNSPSAKVALRKAVLMAKIFDGKVTVLYVVTETKANKSEEIKNHITEIAAKEKINIDYIERHGKIYKEVVKLEKELNADIVMMGTHGVTGFLEGWIGSNAFRVVSSSQCPVITMQESVMPDHFQKILLPLADSRETRQKVPFICELAAGFDAEVVIFCVSKETDKEAIARLHTYAEQAKKYLDERGIKHSYDESFGKNVAEECIDFSVRNGIDLISIMTETENTHSFFMGTYAQQLVNHSPIPVISIHARSTMRAGASGY